MILLGQQEVRVMPANALIQTRIDEDIKARATVVLEKSGLTVSDAVRILLTRTANEGALPIELAGRDLEAPGYDAWFRAKVQHALDDIRSPLAHDDVEDHFANKRAKLMAQSGAK
jgi:DNA-damage-inducible protein J